MLSATVGRSFERPMPCRRQRSDRSRLKAWSSDRIVRRFDRAPVAECEGPKAVQVAIPRILGPLGEAPSFAGAVPFFCASEKALSLQSRWAAKGQFDGF